MTKFLKLKKIDILLCLSGTTSGGNLVYNFTTDEFNANIISTIKSTFVCNKEVLKYLIKSKGGSIINISSIAEKNLIGSSILQQNQQFQNLQKFWRKKILISI